MINLSDSEESVSEDESVDDGVDSLSESVKLKSGLILKEVETENGAMFEIQPLENELELDTYENDEKYFCGEEMYKHCKSELAAIDSDEEEGEDKNMSPFEKMGRHMLDISPQQDRSILKQIIHPGIGEVIEEKAKVTIHYNAYFEYQSEPYDSTYLRNKKFCFRIGEGETILGLDWGVSTMSVKEKSYFLLKPEWAYGEHGCPPRIPENATLFFEVILTSALDDYAAEAFKKLSLEEQNAASFSQIMKVVRAEHQTGNSYMKEKRYEKASSCYYRAIRLLENSAFNNETEGAEANALLLKLYQNQCLLFDRMGQFRKIKKPAHEALKLNPTSSKALFRLGRAHSHFCEWSKARKFLLDAQRIEPSDATITEELIRLDKRQAEFKEAEKLFCHKIFSKSSLVDENNSSQSSNDANLVSEEFQNLVLDTLTSFKLDEAKTEMLLPSFSNIEIACVAANVKVLEDLKMEFCPDNSIKITKK